MGISAWEQKDGERGGFCDGRGEAEWEEEKRPFPPPGASRRCRLNGGEEHRQAQAWPGRYLLVVLAQPDPRAVELTNGVRGLVVLDVGAAVLLPHRHFPSAAGLGRAALSLRAATAVARASLRPLPAARVLCLPIPESSGPCRRKEGESLTAEGSPGRAGLLLSRGGLTRSGKREMPSLKEQPPSP